MTRAQRSYHAFIRTIKAEKGITHKQAIGAARALKVKLGRSVQAVDIKRHPRLTAKAVAKGVRSGKKTVPPAALRQAGKRAARRGGGYEEFEDYGYDEYGYEEFEDYGYDEYVLDISYEE